MPAYIDISNQKFGRLTVLRDTGKRKKGSVVWVCKCDCGQEITAKAIDLRQGEVKSCGCLRRTNPNARRHGMSWGTSRTREYITWILMRDRCSNPKNKRFQHYGGRGIGVCERWELFENFLTDMGPRPDGYSIERIDNDLGYEPKNCTWIPKADQAKNRSRFHSHR
jgi:hypothetical protein